MNLGKRLALLAMFVMLICALLSCGQGSQGKTDLQAENFCRISVSVEQLEKRSAHALSYPETWYWQAVAEEELGSGGGTALKYTSDKAKLDGSGIISLNVQPGKTYTITFNAYESNASDAKLLMSGSKKLPVPADASEFDCKIRMTSLKDTGVNGTISLKFDFSGIENIDTVSIQDYDGLDSSKLNLIKGSAGIYTLEGNDVTPKTYTFKLELTYTSGSGKPSAMVYIRDVTVEPGRETNKWTGIGDAQETYTVTEGEIMIHRKFYVSSSTSPIDPDARQGSQLNPFGSLQAAVYHCDKDNVEYSIYILNTITGADACATINGDKIINLIGHDFNPSDSIVPKLDANANSTSQRRILSIEGNVRLSIKNLTLVNGYMNMNGGAIHHTASKDLTLDNVIIENCEANGIVSGGALYFNPSNTDAKCMLNKVEIRGCSANDGGGILIKTGKVEMTNGSITSCSAKDNGGGIYLSTGCTFTMKKSAYLDRQSVIYLEDNTTVAVEGTLTPPKDKTKGIAAFIKPAAYPAAPHTVAAMTGNYNEAENYKKFKVLPERNSDNSLKQIWTIDLNGKYAITDQVSTWEELKWAVETKADSTSKTIIIDGEIKATKADGNNGVITVPGKENYEITIKGNDQEKDIINANCENVGANYSIFNQEKFGTNLIIENITLTGGRAYYGGAIYICDKKAIFTMKNACISDNIPTRATGDKMGGAIYIEQGRVYIKDGSIIKDNTADTDGGGIHIEGGRVIMSGGSITGNTSPKGAGVYVNGGSFEMSGGSITGNIHPEGTSSSDVKGSGVYVSSGSFKMSGKAKVGAGGENNTVYLANGKSIEITGVLSGTETFATIEPEKYTDGANPVTVLSGNLALVETHYDKFKLTDDVNYKISPEGRIHDRNKKIRILLKTDENVRTPEDNTGLGEIPHGSKWKDINGLLMEIRYSAGYISNGIHLGTLYGECISDEYEFYATDTTLHITSQLKSNFSVNEDGVITAYNGSSTYVFIPNEIDETGKKVTAIGPGVFKTNTSIESIDLSTCTELTKIDAEAFKWLY